MSQDYTASDITILEGLEPVRKRPGMYIGGVGPAGLHHLVWEVLDNAVDEAINGHANGIYVQLDAGGKSISVEDNGRGIPIEPLNIQDRLGRSTLEVIFTELHAGGKFEQGAYRTAGGLHGVGASVVNALSESLCVRVKRDGNLYEQRFERGRALGKIDVVGEARGTGTFVHFVPDADIFESVDFDADLIRQRLEVKTYLHQGLRIVFRDDSSGQRRSDEFRHEGGISEYLSDLLNARNRRAILSEVIEAEKDDDDGRLNVALTWTESTDTLIHSFVNGIPTQDGGTHEAGLRDAVNKAVREYIDVHDLCPRGVNIGSDDIREGLTAVINLFIREPQFQGQTKISLTIPKLVILFLGPCVQRWSNGYTNQTQAQTIVTRVIQAAKARQASRSAAAAVRRKTPVSHRLNLPGKLADCSSTDPTESELFLVEGDSAGGSAKQGRDRQTQAILPLRGKVLNAEQAPEKKVRANQELCDIVKALGCGMGQEIDLNRLRYGKVVLLMDADSDGHHIATLLLTFFYRYLRPLIDAGVVFIAQPPLYRVDVGKQTYWAADDAQKNQLVEKFSSKGKVEIQRFKGLGEMMPATLYKTTLDPLHRRLLQVKIDDEERLMTETVITELMGKDPQARFHFVVNSADQAGALDI